MIDFSELTGASCELHVACDREGVLRFVDERARRLLDVHEGDSVRARVVPGCEAKLDDFLARAWSGAIAGIEIPFVVRGKATTVSLSSTPRREMLLVLGHVIPEAFAHAVDQVNAMIGEVTELNRELRRVNGELSESNQGIIALHHELQEKSEQTLQDNVIKSRLVSNLSHELRTPLHSILGLVQLLTSGRDGELTGEQSKQIEFIRTSAGELLALIDDVLDLGRLDAGHARIHVDRFTLADFVGAIRGALRPLLVTPEVELLIDDPPPDIELETDRTKLSQIVRNLVSNALKFTERGMVHVEIAATEERLRIAVRDTGVGIAHENFDRIFEEYGQVDSQLQRRLKGTGLGLPLARRLAERLGGAITVASEVGTGSTFTLDIPLRHAEARVVEEMMYRSRHKAPDAASILVVEDDRQTLFLYEKYLVMAGFHVMPARTLDDAMRWMREHRPAAVVLDVMLEGDASWRFLAQLKGDPQTRDIPVLVVTVTNREDKARALGADEFWLKPVDQERLLRKLRQIARKDQQARVLVIDDDATARYIIRRHLEGTQYVVAEASSGEEGVSAAREQHPHVILLDFLLEGCTAFDVIDELKADPRTRAIPIIVVTSHVLDASDQRRLLDEAEAVISKQSLSRELAINRIRDALAKVAHTRES